jgi:predicted N-acyltransferase
MRLAPPTSRITVRQIESLADVAPTAWDTVAGDNPFLRHAFLVALERSGCVGPATAWLPRYLVALDDEGLLAGAMPAYLKLDSRGEFVFDWSWAEAYERSGLRYYPKLVSAVPFTPANGPRLLVAPDQDRSVVVPALIDALQQTAGAARASSIHVLFPDEPSATELADAGFLPRKSCQFHWRNGGYRDFEDFLTHFTSVKRKKVRRERRRIVEAGIVFEHLRGNEIAASDWDAIFEFYTRTFMLRGRPPYLNRAFFDEVAQTMSDNLLVVLARFQSKPIATAICFRSDTALYGRYWGSVADFNGLHFETCYYQGIDYCIRERLALFEPGTQGEHKISRGFSPTTTWSFHRMLNSGFHAAVADFLEREGEYVDHYIDDLDEHVPYKNEEA